tara:strand:- start:2128 stop:2634 length:507 start_codon:yes stop_codon:yes gene_type:complete
MALFGSARDISVFHKINNELLDNIISQEVDYYQVNLENTPTNLYGEASENKVYNAAIRLTCLIERGDQTFNIDDQFGSDASQQYTFKFLHNRLEELNLYPEVGDLIENRGNFYEIDNINENQFIVGKDSDFPKNVGSEYGKSFSMICVAHYTRVSKLQIVSARGGNNV